MNNLAFAEVPRAVEPWENIQWKRGKLASFHSALQKKLNRSHVHIIQEKQLRDANEFLLTMCDKHLLPGCDLVASASREEVKLFCHSLTLSLTEAYEKRLQRRSVNDAVWYLFEECQKREVEFPLTEVQVRNYLLLIETFPLIEPAVKRVLNQDWWFRKVQTKQKRLLDQFERALGWVHRRKQVYCTDYTLRKRTEQKRRNQRILEGLEAVSEDGEVVNLADCVESSMANPKLRRMELMTRMRGFEEVAELLGHHAGLFTLTTPSKYHAMHSSGQRNRKFKGYSPKDAQSYLVDLWARVRAEWDRHKIDTGRVDEQGEPIMEDDPIKGYGFRVVEPHHDGTPHWHLLLFFEKRHYFKAVSIFKKHAIKADRAELGSNTKPRFDVVTIDPAKGSATGYVAKYISKNIDGFEVGTDLESGKPADQSAQRVEAWASCWGIRQFQQIGGPQVGIWRELRRVSSEELTEQFDLLGDAVPQPIEQIHGEADSGNWAAFVLLMGGPTCRRSAQALAMLWEPSETENIYGECPDALSGVYPNAVIQDGEIMQEWGVAFLLCTRLKDWVIQRVSAVTDAAAAAWSSVNNCTGNPNAEELDYLRGSGAAYG